MTDEKTIKQLEQEREIFEGDWKNYWCIYCDNPLNKCDCPEYTEPDN